MSKELKRAPRAGPAALSMAIRMPILAELSSEEATLASLVSSMEQIKHADEAAKAMRLTGHPYLKRPFSSA
eukprot:6164774-Karenia_brevis.AAC.1